MIRKIRLTLAVVVLTLITLLFADSTGTVYPYLGWLAKIQFLPAVLAVNGVVVVALLLLTFLCGRIYCSVICPLGIMQDVLAWTRRKKNRYSFSPEKRVLRFSVLAIFCIAAAFGVSAVVSLLAPYSTYGRIVTSFAHPAASWVTFGIALATFAILTILARHGGRTYCNTICPVGTVLSLVSRFSLMKMQIDEDRCKKCRKCERNCKASCIDSKNGSIDYSRCVVCGDCEQSCEFGAIRYVWKGKQETKGVDTGRRTFLVGAGLALAGSAMAETKIKVDGGLAVIEDKIAPERKTPITPPGSLSAKHLQQHCTACQLCISQCPNKVLRPSTELSNLMQPTMSYEEGYCRVECTTCSEVCPTGAIQRITPAEKSAIQIGHAVLIPKNCIPLVNGDSCGNCAAHCPSGAIIMVEQSEAGKPKIPTVDESRCIGCGACENLCPARPFSAIYVEGNHIHHEA